MDFPEFKVWVRSIAGVERFWSFGHNQKSNISPSSNRVAFFSLITRLGGLLATVRTTTKSEGKATFTTLNIVIPRRAKRA